MSGLPFVVCVCCGTTAKSNGLFDGGKLVGSDVKELGKPDGPKDNQALYNEYISFLCTRKTIFFHTRSFDRIFLVNSSTGSRHRRRQLDV